MSPATGHILMRAAPPRPPTDDDLTKNPADLVLDTASDDASGHNTPEEKRLTTLVTLNEKTFTTSDCPSLTPQEKRRLLWKIDLHLLPFLTLLYFFSFLDRSVIGNANIYGMSKDIGATATHFSQAVSLFYVTYGFFESITNIGVKIFRPSRWLSSMTILVGCCMLSQGTVKSSGALLATRICLGIVESSLFPGVNYLFSGWYRRSEFGIRSAIFFAAASIAGAFGGCLAAALQNIHVGSGVYQHGWRWIFIVIGLATAVVGFAGFWLVPNFPEHCSWMSERERIALKEHLAADQIDGSDSDGLDKKHQIMKAFLDIKTYGAIALYSSINPPLYSFATFASAVIKDAFPGRGPTQANLLSTPVFAFACIIVIGTGFFTAKHQRRVMVELFFLCVGAVGYIVLISVHSPVVRYVFLFFASLGSYPLVANSITLCSQIPVSLTRGVTIGLFAAAGNMLGAGSTAAYKLPGKDKMYRTGHGACLAFYGSGILVSLTIYYLYRRENGLRDRGARDETILSPIEYPNIEDRLRIAAEAHKRRLDDIAADPSLNFLTRSITLARAKCHSLPGGTYASVDHARLLKGADWSGHRFQT